SVAESSGTPSTERTDVQCSTWVAGATPSRAATFVAAASQAKPMTSRVMEAFEGLADGHPAGAVPLAQRRFTVDGPRPAALAQRDAFAQVIRDLAEPSTCHRFVYYTLGPIPGTCEDQLARRGRSRQLASL